MLAIHPDRLRKLRTQYSDTDLISAIRHDQVSVPAEARLVLDLSETELLDRVSGISVVMAGDDDFPQRLSDLPDSPDVLFVDGSIPATAMVGIVGTRKCTSYGRRIANALGRAVAAAGGRWFRV